MSDEQEILKNLLPIARTLVKGPRLRRSMPAGYGIKPAEKVLIGVNSMYDEAVVKAIVQAIREVGAKVDLISYDMGPDRELEYIDEMRGFIHHWRDIKEENPLRWWKSQHRWIEKVAQENGYDLLIHSLGGPLPPSKDEKPHEYQTVVSTTPTSYAYEGIPWITRDIFPAAKFPHELYDKINRKTWEKIWNNARGGQGRVTDPEGTDISWTFWDKYFDLERYKENGSAPLFQKEPFLGHLFGRPTPPYLPEDDAEGVVAGTTNHFGRPFPNIKVYIEKNRVVRVEGGGEYGDLFRELLEDTKEIHYPEHPNKGLLYWWEFAIGTNPKMGRPFNSFMLSGGGTVCERLRSGIIHMGFGTCDGSPSEIFAEKNRLIYGHVHVHQFFGNFEITTKQGEIVKIIERGHLTALDDPEVIDLASKFGDPKELLKEDWIPPIPGINVAGNYQDYSTDPCAFIKNYRTSTGRTSV